MTTSKKRLKSLRQNHLIKYLTFCLLLLHFLAFDCFGFEPASFQGNILDETNLLSKEQIQSLESQIQQVRMHADVLAAIYIVPTLNESTIEEAAEATFKKWELGQKEKNNGLLIMLAMKERRMRIEVGLGLEGILPDATCFAITERMKYKFREGKYSDGLADSLTAIKEIVKGEKLTIPGIVPSFFDDNIIVPIQNLTNVSYSSAKKIYFVIAGSYILSQIILFFLFYLSFLLLIKTTGLASSLFILIRLFAIPLSFVGWILFVFISALPAIGLLSLEIFGDIISTFFLIEFLSLLVLVPLGLLFAYVSGKRKKPASTFSKILMFSPLLCLTPFYPLVFLGLLWPVWCVQILNKLEEDGSTRVHAYHNRSKGFWFYFKYLYSFAGHGDRNSGGFFKSGSSGSWGSSSSSSFSSSSSSSRSSSGGGRSGGGGSSNSW